MVRPRGEEREREERDERVWCEFLCERVIVVECLMLDLTSILVVECRNYS